MHFSWYYLIKLINLIIVIYYYFSNVAAIIIPQQIFTTNCLYFFTEAFYHLLPYLIGLNLYTIHLHFKSISEGHFLRSCWRYLNCLKSISDSSFVKAPIFPLKINNRWWGLLDLESYFVLSSILDLLVFPTLLSLPLTRIPFHVH